MRLVFGVVTFFPLALAAQVVLQAATIETQPLVYTDDDGPSGCGVRLVASFPPSRDSVSGEFADFSVNFFAAGAGMTKVSLITVPDLRLPGRDKTVAPADFAIMSEDGKISPSVAKKERSSEAPAMLAVISLDDSLALYGAVLAGRRLHLRTKRQGDNYFRVLAFAATFKSDADRQTAVSCVSGVTNRLDRIKNKR